MIDIVKRKETGGKKVKRGFGEKQRRLGCGGVFQRTSIKPIVFLFPLIGIPCLLCFFPSILFNRLWLLFPSELLLLALLFCPIVLSLGSELNISQFPEVPRSQFHLYLTFANMIIQANCTLYSFSRIFKS